MKSVLNLYTGIGKSTQASLNRHLPFLLDGPKPPSWQTPGRLQYYRAENEVYLPGKSPRFLLIRYFYRRDQVAAAHAGEVCDTR